jgi:hypothetical protein
VSRRPAGANHFLKLRRSLDEHLQSGRMTWNEFAMFVWLCLKASHRTGVLRTSWPQLEIETRLPVKHVEQLCRALRRKRYVWYPWHLGRRGQYRMIELAIDKYPTAGTQTSPIASRRRNSRPIQRPTCRSRRTSTWKREKNRKVRPLLDRDREETETETETETESAHAHRTAGTEGTGRKNEPAPTGTTPRRPGARTSGPPWPSESCSPPSPGGDSRRRTARARARVRARRTLDRHRTAPERRPRAAPRPAERRDEPAPTRSIRPTGRTGSAARGLGHARRRSLDQ